jgi:hypothetical protein
MFGPSNLTPLVCNIFFAHGYKKSIRPIAKAK